MTGVRRSFKLKQLIDNNNFKQSANRDSVRVNVRTMSALQVLGLFITSRSPVLKSFTELTLPEALQKALKVMGLQTPTPIQALAIPAALSRRDVIGCAQTGTGKTAAFAIPVVAALPQAAG